MLPSDAYPGCLVLAHTRGFYGFLIRAAQTIRWKRGRMWNHAAIVTAMTDGVVLCTEMAWHCEEVTLDEVAPGGHLLILPAPKGTDVIRAANYAKSKVGTKYGVLTIVSIFVNLFTPKFFRVAFRSGNGSLICSALVVRAWEHGGANLDSLGDPFQVSPAELAEAFAA